MPFKKTGSNTAIDIQVNAGSKNFAVLKVDEWSRRLKVKCASVAKDNKANKEIIKKFTEIFSKDVKIVSGEKNNKKTLLVYGLTPEQAIFKLDINEKD
ncbi:MAG: YggU family protein [Candidatus Diapherotrites archaeon]|nr:YggU family protein [Candidatus Diapherotrites archaeon]